MNTNNLPATDYTFDRLMSGFFDPINILYDRKPTYNTAKVDIIESNDKYTVVADAPGVNKDCLSIGVEGNLLTISIKESKVTLPEGSNYLMRGRKTPNAVSTIRLPKPADGSNVDAELVNGVLTVTVGKMEVAKRIEIKVK